MRYCAVCGRPLTKTQGPVGPVCLAKLQGRQKNRRKRKVKRGDLSYIDMFEGQEA